MTLTEDKEIDIFVGTKIGSFKHIKYHTDPTKNNKKNIENLVDIKSLQKDDGITCMVWGNTAQTEILLARKNQQIQSYDTLHGFTTTYNGSADFGTGHVVGLGRCQRKMVAALSSGVVKIWSKKSEELVEVGKMDKMKLCQSDDTLFATGGEENDLKVYRVGTPEPLFCAKNLPHDWLQLRRPVWVADLTFLEEHLLAVCSRHGYVRLYDTRAQRRPVVNVDFPMAATCIAPSLDERKVVVGFARGQLHLVDLRVGRPDKGYKGCAGAVTAATTAGRRVVSTSLDRQIRVHDYDSKAMEYRQYLTSKLTCLLVQTESSTPLRCKPEVKEEEDVTQPEQIDADDMDQLFDNMETVSEKKKSRKKKLPEESTEAKKQKPSTEGSTEPEQEDAIFNLLRSTEKQKKKREKKKREKKAKSVFHNA